jgi:hypothetical protein
MIKFSATTLGFYDSKDHKIFPDDAVEVTAQERDSILSLEQKGKRISFDEQGNPIAIDPPSPTIRQQIVALESKITQRRLREALLTDAGKSWLENIETELAALRAQL